MQNSQVNGNSIVAATNNIYNYKHLFYIYFENTNIDFINHKICFLQIIIPLARALVSLSAHSFHFCFRLCIFAHSHIIYLVRNVIIALYQKKKYENTLYIYTYTYIYTNIHANQRWNFNIKTHTPTHTNVLSILQINALKCTFDNLFKQIIYISIKKEISWNYRNVQFDWNIIIQNVLHNITHSRAL